MAPYGTIPVTGLVGATGFEPATSCSRSRRATELRYAPLLLCCNNLTAVCPTAERAGVQITVQFDALMPSAPANALRLELPPT